MKGEGEAIISIRPHYAQAIIEGRKTVELRRRIPPVSAGTRLWIYATRPVAAIIGLATVERVVRGEPAEIWLTLGDQAAIDRSAYDAYFDGANEAIGLLLADVERNIQQVAIERLRDLRDGFHPPQTTMWISNAESDLLRQMANAVS